MTINFWIFSFRSQRILYKCSKDVEINDYRILPPTRLTFNQKKHWQSSNVNSRYIQNKSWRTYAALRCHSGRYKYKFTCSYANQEQCLYSNSEIQQYKNLTEDEVIPKLSKFFKIGRLKNLDIENKTIRITVPDWPAGLMADGCATNVSALRQLSENISLLSLTICCISHAVDCSIKRKSKSKPMNAEVS